MIACARSGVGHDSQFQLFFPEFSKSHKNGGKERERERERESKGNACGRSGLGREGGKKGEKQREVS